MEKDKITILEDRGLISVSGKDAKEFLQNILSNNINKVNSLNSIFSAIFTPQGKYLYEFFVIKSKKGFFIDCDNEFTTDIINHLNNYKLRSKVQLENLSSDYVIGVISLNKFDEVKQIESKNTQTIMFRESPFFIDTRSNKLGVRILSSLEKLHLTIKELNLEIVDNKEYIKKAHKIGIPIKGLKNLKEKLFGLEANLEELGAIDYQKGCYVGQENTARMKLKNKIRKKLFSVRSNEKLKVGSEITFINKTIGKILIDSPYPFALINLFNPDFLDFRDKDIFCENKKINLQTLVIKDDNK
ncbi:MAG: YgfZ/GcvT domain-containing protein [Pelagibacteraceae bacterium]